MANCLPFNSIDHDRVYKAEDWAWYFATFIANGIFPKPSDGLQVVAYDKMEVKVSAGYAFINGYAFRNTESHSITLSMAEGAFDRIDRVIVRWNLTQRDMYLDVLKGVPSANPTAPALTRNTEIWELAIADIYVAKGVTSIQQADITDQRFNTSVCGIVKGTIEEIDVSVLTIQFNDFFAKYKADILTQYGQYTDDLKKYLDKFSSESSTKFNNWYSENTESWEEEVYKWFNVLKDQLSENAAVNLQNQIYNINAILREITEDEIDDIINGTYEEDDEGGSEPDIYSRLSDEEIDDMVDKAYNEVM